MSGQPKTDDPDLELARRFREGDKFAFSKLHERHAEGVFRFVKSRCNHTFDLEGICQEVWLKAWAAQSSYQDRHFGGWIYEIARNLVIDCERRKSSVQMPEDVDVPAVLEHDRPEELSALEDCLESGTGDFVQAVRDSLLGGTTPEIAAKYDISATTVYTRISRGRELLRECVEEKLK